MKFFLYPKILRLFLRVDPMGGQRLEDTVEEAWKLAKHLNVYVVFKHTAYGNEDCVVDPEITFEENYARIVASYENYKKTKFSH